MEVEVEVTEVLVVPDVEEFRVCGGSEAGSGSTNVTMRQDLAGGMG